MSDQRGLPKRGEGIVYISWDILEGRYSGCWEKRLDGRHAPVERLPHTGDLQRALEWGRERTSIVMVRPSFAPDVMYWGGHEPKPDRYSELPSLPDL